MPAPSPALPAPAQLLAGRREWGTGVPQPPLPRGSSAPAFSRLSHFPRVFRLWVPFSEEGAVHAWEPRAGAGGAGALGSFPAGNRARTASKLGEAAAARGRLLRDRAVGLTHRLKNTTCGNFPPRARLSPGSPGSRRGCLRARVWLSAGAGAAELHPRPLSLSRFSASSPQTHPSLLPHTQRPECRE